MKTPLPPGEPIDAKRMRGWLSEFTGYRHAVTESRIERWLSQFELPDIDLAARLLDSVDFIQNEQITAWFRSALEDIPGWDAVPPKRSGTFRFVALSASAGESGDAMLARFRHANNLGSKKHHHLFAHRSQLLLAGLGEGDTVVFVDDFSGTGKQVVDYWPVLKEVLPEGPDYHLVLAGASRGALREIAANTDLLVHTGFVLEPCDALFSPACTTYTEQEKKTVKKYCDEVGAKSAAEFAAQGFLVVFAHTCPNNSLPVLHRTSPKWEGLFRRYD